MSKTYLVTFGYDMGGPESGPRVETNEEFVEANSKKEAEQIIIDTYSNDGSDSFGSFAGCWAREATEKDVAEMIEAMKKSPQYEPEFEYWSDPQYELDPRIWTGLESVPEQWKYLLNEDIKSATSVESDNGLWVLEDVKSVKDSDGFYTDYTLWSNITTGEWCCVFGDSDIYTPAEGWTDAEFDTEDEAREWFDNYTGFDEDDVEAATDISRPDPEGDNLYGSDMNLSQKKYDMYKLRDALAAINDDIIGLRDKYWGEDVQFGLSVLNDQLYNAIQTWDKFFNI